MNVFLTPSGKPFFGGTYYGREDLPGRPSFRSLLTLICGRWKAEAGELEASSSRVLEQLKKTTDFVSGGSDSNGDVTRIKAIQKAFFYFQDAFDRDWGGFGQGNKFPMPGTIAMLLRYWALWKELASPKNPPTIAELRQQFASSAGLDEAKLRAMWDQTVQGGLKMAGEALAMAQFTLVSIVRSGIRDHIGGGFHRYCVDRSWTLPHFEKMLNDQAQLIHVLSEAALLMEDPSEFTAAIRDTIDYARSRLLDQHTGLFYAAEDADSINAAGEREEGFHVIWTDEQVNKCLLEDAKWSAEDVKVFKYHYTILPRGNVNKPPINVLRERGGPRITAEKLKRPLEQVEKILSEGKQLLLEHRIKNRANPHRDEKIVTAWNAMMIGALARASRSLQAPEYLEMAQKAAKSLLQSATWTLSKSDETAREYLCLRRVVGNDQVSGFAEDYACMIGALIELYEADFNPEWLDSAVQLFGTLDEFFRDKAAFGYYDTPKIPLNPPGSDTVAAAAAPFGILRVKSDYDGVEPSANSQQALNALHLHLLQVSSGSKQFMERLRQIEKVFTRKRLEKEPQAMTTLISAIIMDASKPATLVLNGKPSGEVRRLLDTRYRPNLVIKVAAAAAADGTGGEATKAQLCRGNACVASVPISEISSLLD